MKYTTTAIILACVVHLGSFSVHAQQDTLQAAFTDMLLFEPELSAGSWETEAARDDHRAVKGEMLPQISAYGSTGYSKRKRDVDGLIEDAGGLFTRRVGLNVRQLLFDFGAASNRAKSAGFLAEVEHLAELDESEARAVDLMEIYLEVLRTNDQINEAKRNMADHRSILNKLKQRAAGGYSSADLALVEGRLSLAETSLQTQYLALERALDRFRRLVGRAPSDQMVKPGFPQVPRSLDGLDYGNVWSILAAEKVLKAAGAAKEAAKRERLPKVFAEAGGSLGQDVSGIPGADHEYYGLLSMSWNLWDGGTQDAIAKRDAKLENRASDLLKAAEYETSYQGSLAMKELIGVEETMGFLVRYSDKLAKVEQDYLQQFNLGRRELLGILDVKNERHTAQTRLIDTRYNRLTIGYRLLGIQGRLVEQIMGKPTTAGELKREMGVESQPIAFAEAASGMPSPSPALIAQKKREGRFGKIEKAAAPQKSSGMTRREKLFSKKN